MACVTNHHNKRIVYPSTATEGQAIPGGPSLRRNVPGGPSFPRQWDSSSNHHSGSEPMTSSEPLDDKHFDANEENELKAISAGIRTEQSVLAPPTPLQQRDQNGAGQPFKPVVVNPVVSGKRSALREERRQGETPIAHNNIPLPTSGRGSAVSTTIHNPYLPGPSITVANTEERFPSSRPQLHSNQHGPNGYSQANPNYYYNPAGDMHGKNFAGDAGGAYSDPMPRQPMPGTWWNSNSNNNNNMGAYPTQTIRASTPPYTAKNALLDVQQNEMHLHYDNVPYTPDPSLGGMTPESFERRVEQRQKQIAYGKATEGYKKYLEFLPDKSKREFRNEMHPITPRADYDCSKRTFDKYLNTWRRRLHYWDSYSSQAMHPQYRLRGTHTLGDLGLAKVTAPCVSPPAAMRRNTPTGMPPKMQSIAGAMLGTGHTEEDNGTPLTGTRRLSPSVVFDGSSPFCASGSAMRHSSLCTPSRAGPDGPEVGSNFFNSTSTINSPYIRPGSGFHATNSANAYINNNNSGNGYGVPPPRCGLTPHSKTPSAGPALPPNYSLLFSPPNRGSPFNRFSRTASSPYNSEEFNYNCFGNSNSGPSSLRPSTTIQSTVHCKMPNNE